MLKSQFSKNNTGTIKRRAGGVHAFPKCICLKLNVIAQMELEIAYYDVAVTLHEDSSKNKLIF